MKDTNTEIMKQITSDWEDNERHMGEQAALCVACESNGKSTEWFYDHIDLISIITKT